MKTYDKVLAIHRGGFTKRFHTLPTVGVDTVASHSFGVAWLATLLANGDPSAALLVECLRHDLAEAKFGDIPSPVKKTLGGKFSEMEEEYMESVGLTTPALLHKERRILKLADNLDGLRFCIAEYNHGNRELMECEANYRRYIEEMNPQGVEREVFDAIMSLKIGGI